MAELGSLWVGKNITKIQEICFSSFVKHGHKVNLFVYEDIGKVPDQVVLRDANDVMAYDGIGNMANFADVFRYKMVEKFNFGWVDADTICLTDEWFPDDEYYCIMQHNGEVQNGIFRLPQGSDILQHIIKSSDMVDRSLLGWTDTNSNILNKAFDMFPDYKRYLIDESLVNGIEWQDWYYLWTPEHFKNVIEISKNIKSFSVYNEMASRAGIDKNNLPSGSAIEFFYNKYVLGLFNE